MKDVTKQLRHRYTIQWMKTFKFVLVEKLYAERSEAKKILNLNYEIWSKYEWKSMPSEARLKKKYRTIKRGPKKLNFGASKPGVGGVRAPRAPLDPLVLLECFPVYSEFWTCPSTLTLTLDFLIWICRKKSLLKAWSITNVSCKYNNWKMDRVTVQETRLYNVTRLYKIN